MDKIGIKTYIFVVVFMVFCLMFLLDPFKWFPPIDINKPCTAESIRPSCTGRVVFFWQ